MCQMINEILMLVPAGETTKFGDKETLKQNSLQLVNVKLLPNPFNPTNSSFFFVLHPAILGCTLSFD